MQTATYIDLATQEAVRRRALDYIACDVPVGMTLDGHRRALAHPDRYADDPAGDYETTDGGW